jgi:hypothetical protein
MCESSRVKPEGDEKLKGPRHDENQWGQTREAMTRDPKRQA